MTGQMLLNWLLILLGPFVVIGLVSVPGLVQLVEPRPRRGRPGAGRRPVARVRAGGWAVAW